MREELRERRRRVQEDLAGEVGVSLSWFRAGRRKLVSPLASPTQCSRNFSREPKLIDVIREM